MTKQEKELVVLGCYIRTRLDKRGFHGYLSESEVSAHIEDEKFRISKELIAPMKRFVEIFEEIK